MRAGVIQGVPDQCVGDGGPIGMRVDQEALTLSGGIRHGDNELGVIVEPMALIGIRPCPVEDEFAVSIIFYVLRRRAHQTLTVVGQQMTRPPAAAWINGAVMLQRRKKFVAQERVVVPDQGVPVLRIDGC